MIFVGKWPRTASGHPSTSGTTGSIAIIKNSKLYIGHAGDSGIALGYDQNKNFDERAPFPLAGTMLTTVRLFFQLGQKKKIMACFPFPANKVVSVGQIYF